MIMATKKSVKNQYSLPLPISKKEVRLDQLILDDKNPRFAGLIEKSSEETILEKFAEEKNLYELIESFRQNGYYEAEPLLVVEDSKNKDRYVVIEGNRRVAALKILFNKTLLQKFSFVEKGKDILLTDAVQEQLKNKIPVQVYKNRDDLWSYLGFRHIKGPMPWDPYSKALYIAGLYKNGRPIDEIVERIGDQNALVYKMFNGIQVLLQAEKQEFIDPKALARFAFSHLYTILGYSNTQDFLGVKIKENTLLKDDPVPKTKVQNLKTLIDFIYGDKEGKAKSAIKSQNPDIRRLDAVLGKPKSVADLKENINQVGALENAFLTTGEEDEMVPNLISEVLAKLKKVSGNLHLLKKADAITYSTAEEIQVLIAEIIERLDVKKTKDKTS